MTNEPRLGRQTKQTCSLHDDDGYVIVYVVSVVAEPTVPPAVLYPTHAKSPKLVDFAPPANSSRTVKPGIDG
jgi:hypothetical protein